MGRDKERMIITRRFFILVKSERKYEGVFQLHIHDIHIGSWITKGISLCLTLALKPNYVFNHLD